MWYHLILSDITYNQDDITLKLDDIILRRGDITLNRGDITSKARWCHILLINSKTAPHNGMPNTKTKKNICFENYAIKTWPWVYMGICLKIACSTFWHLCSTNVYSIILCYWLDIPIHVKSPSSGGRLPLFDPISLLNIYRRDPQIRTYPKIVH